MDMSRIWSRCDSLSGILCGYITECVLCIVLLYFSLWFFYFIICILSECILYVVAALWRNK